MKSNWNEIYLWAKTDKDNKESDVFHPVIYHLLDSAFVAMEIVDKNYLNWQKPLQQYLGIPKEDLAKTLGFIVALHDLGKIAPSFQNKNEYLNNKFKEQGFDTFTARIVTLESPFYHGIETAKIIRKKLKNGGFIKSVDDKIYKTLSIALGGHHGVFPCSITSEYYPETKNKKQWIEFQNQAIEDLVEILGCELPFKIDPKNHSIAAMLINGVTILSDWISSNEDDFHLSNHIPIKDYIAISQNIARISTRKLLKGTILNWENIQPSFSQLFSDDFSIRSFQKCVDLEYLPDIPTQSLTILEGPMGVGKTEMAQQLYARISAKNNGMGLYCALPTIATSNQMFGRFNKFIESQSSIDIASILVNGQSHKINKKANRTQDWFLPRKRSMLVPYGIGTVDQLMLMALNTKHVGLRMFGLVNKVIIIDEVHAYDSYMSTIIDQLLVWLKELGCSVILLSATLPSSKKAELIKSWGNNSCIIDCNEQQAYPLVTIISDDEIKTITPKDKDERSNNIKLEFRDDGENNRINNAVYLKDMISDSGCAAWICNTISEAQDCYQLLKGIVDKDTELYLIHSRYEKNDRNSIENKILEKFSADKNCRPKKSILVATQIIEQSLDLDFDIMMSQLCIIDLLLQRMGRIWRHLYFKDTKEYIIRPGKLQQPIFTVLMPQIENDKIDFGRYKPIYDHFLMAKTIEILKNRETIKLPDDIRALVESAYNESFPDFNTLGVSEKYIIEAKQDLDSEINRATSKAEARLLKKPSQYVEFNENQNVSTDDSEEIMSFLNSQTRNIKVRTVDIVLLTKNEISDNILKNDNLLTHDMIDDLQGRIISVSSEPLAKHIDQLDDCKPKAFEKIAELKNINIIYWDKIAYNWIGEYGKIYTLTYDSEYGARISSS